LLHLLVIIYSYTLFFLRFIFFFFNETATTEIYTLSLHDALPIYGWVEAGVIGKTGGDSHELGVAAVNQETCIHSEFPWLDQVLGDRKSTRLNSSHDQISYAVFCLKKKKK